MIVLVDNFRMPVAFSALAFFRLTLIVFRQDNTHAAIFHFRPAMNDKMIVKDGLIEYQIAIFRQKNIPFVAVDINEPGIRDTSLSGKRLFCQIPAIYLDNATAIANKLSFTITINDRVIKFGRRIEDISIHAIATL